MDKDTLTPGSASREAVHAARDAAHAVEVARLQQVESIGDVVQERFENVLARGTEQDKSIILARVPYICQDIKEIKISLQYIKDMIIAGNQRNDERYVNQDQFNPVQRVVYGLVSLVLIAVVGAVVALVLKQ